ncbi:MAG: M3 family oligoendopeptidase [bacterium]
MKLTKTISVRFLPAIVCAILLASSAVAESKFEPIPESEKHLYTFDLQKNFYADEKAFEADFQKLIAAIKELENLKERVGESAENLYKAYKLEEELTPIWWKLWVYSYLRYAINTDDIQYLDQIEKESGDLEGRIQFIETETQAIDDKTLERFFKSKPMLEEYRFAIEEARRYKPYTLSLAEEQLMASLSPYLESWSEKLYQKLIDRTEFPKIVLDKDTLDIHLHYSVLINSKDRDIRRDTWRGYFTTLAEQRDLYAFTLVKAIETRNKVAQIRGFRNYPEQRFFDLYLDYDHVSAYFDAIADKAYLRKEYERVRQQRIKHITGYDTVYIWDRTVQSEDFEKPRFTIKQASQLIIDATSVLGDEYKEEITELLDPSNRLLDIVTGPKRVQGMFSTSYPGGTSQFFAQTFNGYLHEVTGLAHECGHAVHHMLQTKAGVRPTYYSGPEYLTESAAIVNELLIGYYLYREAEDRDLKIYYLEQFLEDVLGLLLNNMFANLELKIYEGIQRAEIKDADHLDEIAMKMTVPYSMYYDKHPEYKTMWASIHHYYDVPMYNVNYVVAQALALVFFDKILKEPGFVTKYIDMLKAGFDRPAPQLILEKTGIDPLDPQLVTSGFEFIENLIGELDSLYSDM